MAIDNPVQDVMQVCGNGHVITDLLRSHPANGLMHCDRCGESTLDRCPTCGTELPGAVIGMGLTPVGSRQPPQFCSACGTAFPWARQLAAPSASPLVQLEALLRRLPRVIRQLRVRHADRPSFRIEDEKDLEDLARALLPLRFDDIRPEARTPRYAQFTRTDFVLAPERLVLILKRARPGDSEEVFLDQLDEDAGYYWRRSGRCSLVAFIHDPEGVFRQPGRLEAACARSKEELVVRCVVAS